MKGKQFKTHREPLGTNKKSVPKHPQRCKPEMQRETPHDRQSPRDLPRLGETGESQAREMHPETKGGRDTEGTLINS